MVGRLLALFLVLLPCVAWAQDYPCVPRALALKELHDKYGEQPAARGVIHTNGSLAELFMSANGETWTFVVTIPGNVPRSCLVAGGQNWQRLPVAQPGEPL